MQIVKARLLNQFNKVQVRLYEVAQTTRVGVQTIPIYGQLSVSYSLRQGKLRSSVQVRDCTITSTDPLSTVLAVVHYIHCRSSVVAISAVGLEGQEGICGKRI